MILPREDIAWVRTEDDHIVPFDGERLADSIQRAAAQVGHSDPLLAESVASAVQLFVCEASSKRTLAAREMAGLVVSVLTMLGFAEVAQAYRLHECGARIRLDEMAAQAGTSLELDFFRQLDAALGAAADGHTSRLEVGGLRACVMRLRGAQRWCASCRTLAEEIVNHVRSRVARMRPPHATMLRLAVVE
jgi:hypothetical protein